MKQNQYEGGSVQGDLVTGDKILGDIITGDKVAGDKVTVYQGLTVEEVATLVVDLKHKDQPTVWDGRIPYLGLTAFREQDAQFFFGRESLVDDLLRRVEQANFIVIAGPSGSGKSSVARAGLLHALQVGRLESSDTWLLGAMQPKGRPIEELAEAVARLAKAPAAGDSIRHEGAANPLALQRQIEALLTDDPRQRCVLLVDQFEEIFTQTKDEALRAAFINLLTTAAQAEGSRTIILLSLRSDFISHCSRFPELRALMSRQFQLVGAMSPQDLAKAITLPALEVGAEIDPVLVSRIIADMKGEPGALPLMSFALRDLFDVEKTQNGEPMDLTLAEYLQRGGIESALERHANGVFEPFSDEQKKLVRLIFSRLIEVGQDRVYTRRTATLQELLPAGFESEQVTAVVSALAREGVRLIITGGTVDEETLTAAAEPSQATVTIAHEKLIDAWPWLRQLVEENWKTIALQNQIAVDAQTWNQEKDDSYLYRGGRLIQVEESLEILQPSLDGLSEGFIRAALDQRQREIEKREAERRRTTYTLAGAAVLFLLLAAVAFGFYLRAEDERQNSENAKATAEIALARIEELNTRVSNSQTREAVLAVNTQSTIAATPTPAVVTTPPGASEPGGSGSGGTTAVNKIGFHTGAGGNQSGLSEYFRSLDAAGIPFVIKSVDDYGVIAEAAQYSNAGHVLIYRISTVGQSKGFSFDVPDYSLQPDEAAAIHWETTNNSLPAEFDKSKVWLEILSEPQAEQSEWLAEFFMEIAALANGEGYKIVAFSWNAGEPEEEVWRGRVMGEFLEYAAENPEQVAIGLHEYSFDTENILRGYPLLVGRFQLLYQVMDDLGLPRPTVLITEFGWGFADVPPVEQALREIEVVSQIYATYPEVKGAALWTLQAGFQDIDDQVQQLIAPITAFTLNTSFAVSEPETGLIEYETE